MENNNISRVKMLVESAVMLAIATVLSFLKLIDLPYGGSVTIASMLPVIIISYRHGIRWGLLTGFVYGIIQQLLGLNTLSWVSTWQSVVAVIMLDYILAFAMLGFAGLFRTNNSQPMGILWGALLVCVLRYICHVISGATVWAGLSIPTNAALIYSIGYNATYMIPETIVTMIVGYYLGSILDFRRDRVRPYRGSKGTALSIFQWLGGLVLAAGLTVDTVLVFSKLQNAESGDFDITGLSAVNWTTIGIVSAAAIAVAVVLFIVAARNKKAE
ncbi:MAG: energy-coupled thiamine transporter ThiT [Firmicutes bacterium]|nr:energy-coupled thiamine transporter ThiT [Bacillota bacterium]